MKNTQMDLSDKIIVDYYEQSREGRDVKTIIIKAIIATDDVEDYYFYIFY